MDFTTVSLCLVTMLALATVGVDSQTCTKQDACSCDFGSGIGVVDLSPLSGNPKWADQPDPSGGTLYSYNPCHSFTEGSCSNVAACQVAGDGNYWPIGSQESANFENDPVTGALVISYSSDYQGVTRTSKVSLTCIDSGPDTLTVTGELVPGSAQYEFNLQSVHCCPTTSPPPKPGPQGGGSEGLSIGWIMSIVFFAMVFVYLIGGTAFAVGVQKKSIGKEAIPNSGLWLALPGLVKDGVMFTVRRGRREGYGSV